MLKVLIIDDSIFAQKLLANHIRKFLDGTDIYFSSDGEEGFKKYIEIKPDYIFVDLLMPKMNGQMLIGKIKECDSNAKIFVVSADVQKEIRDEIEALNIEAFINKPFTEDKAQVVCTLIKEREYE